MAIKVGINGMGRIGRMVLRSIIESNNKNIEIKHINNRTGPEACSTLIKYDSIHGKLNAEIEFDENHSLHWVLHHYFGYHHFQLVPQA